MFLLFEALYKPVIANKRGVMPLRLRDDDEG